MTQYSYVKQTSTEPTLPDEDKVCAIDGGALTVSGDVWVCDQSPQHTYEIFRRGDGAYLYHPVDDGIVDFEAAVLTETVQLVEVVVARAAHNAVLSEQIPISETIVTADFVL